MDRNMILLLFLELNHDTWYLTMTYNEKKKRRKAKEKDLG